MRASSGPAGSGSGVVGAVVAGLGLGRLWASFGARWCGCGGCPCGVVKLRGVGVRFWRPRLGQLCLGRLWRLWHSLSASISPKVLSIDVVANTAPVACPFRCLGSIQSVW